MAITSYINGAGGTTGSKYAVLPKVTRSGFFYFIGNSVSGASDSNTGLERGKPLLTTAQAYANAAAGDTIVYLSGHVEDIGTTVVVAKAGLILAGEGEGASLPRLTCTASIAMLDITAAGVIVDSIVFPVSAAAPTARIRIASADVRLANLSFDCGASDTTRAVSYVTGASSATIDSCRFTATAATPASAIEVINALAGLTIDNLILDAGSFEWSAAAFLGTEAVTRLVATRVYQLAGSDVTFATGTTGHWEVTNNTGNSRLTWTV